MGVVLRLLGKERSLYDGINLYPLRDLHARPGPTGKVEPANGRFGPLQAEQEERRQQGA